jgi:hypothetical protein
MGLRGGKSNGFARHFWAAAEKSFNSVVAPLAKSSKK